MKIAGLFDKHDKRTKANSHMIPVYLDVQK